jgi:hypothetical protein
MNKIIFLGLVIFLFSCNKEKKSSKYIAGDWEIRTYSEIIFDGTINKYDLLFGTAHFDKLIGNSESNFQIAFKATTSLDTVDKNLNGTYKRITLDSLEFHFDNEIYNFDIVRLFKTDMNIQGGLAPNRKSIFIMKKK